jgi:chromate transporter
LNAAFYGLRACSAGLIAAAGLLLVQIALINTDLFSKTGVLFDLIRWKGVLLACALLVLTQFVKKTKRLHPVAFIALSAVIGIVFRFAEG